jgi:hypothetical protein
VQRNLLDEYYAKKGWCRPCSYLLAQAGGLSVLGVVAVTWSS